MVGEPTVLVTTRGFADALRIGYQNRPRLFALDIVLPEISMMRSQARRWPASGSTSIAPHCTTSPRVPLTQAPRSTGLLRRG